MLIHFRTVIFLLVLFILPVRAQKAPYDTIRVMAYNVNNYGFPSSANCPLLGSANKPIWLRTVTGYAAPDILGLEKIAASPATFSADTIVQHVLDSICEGCYAHTPYTNNSGYEKVNMLYYKTAKIGWLSTTTIYSADTNISDINLHRLYYKSPSLAITHDTVFINIVLVHLESGAGSDSERATEISGVMAWLNSHVNTPGNYIIMGDFNTQSSGESCFQQIINSANANTRFTEPVNDLGNWDNDPSAFANYLTQSTRTSDPGDCGATGGMDDWFDHILCSSYLLDGIDSLKYIDSTFKVIGQDGLHVNQSLIASPQNNSVPANVLNALYYMSEHLPVTLQLALGGSSVATGIQSDSAKADNTWFYDRLITNNLHVKFNGLMPGAPLITATIYNMQGQLIIKTTVNTSGMNAIDMRLQADGLYILHISKNNETLLNGRFIKTSR